MSEKIEVYKNLHTGTWSLRDSKSGLVVEHPLCVVIYDAQFVVRPAGRLRVLKENRKNVHAFVRGTRGNLDDVNLGDFTLGVTYDPYIHDSFVLRDNSTKIEFADCVLLNRFGAFLKVTIA